MKPEQHLRVCYFGTYRAEYARNQILIEGLRRNQVEVIECHQPLWRGVEDRVQTASGGWKKPSFWWRVIRAYLSLLGKYFQTGPFDILVVGYPGHYDIFLARFLAWLQRKPLVWDVLNSLYLITTERGIQNRSPITVRLIRALEKLACRLPDRLILDTQRFVDWFCETHHLSSQSFRLVQIGADERFFYPVDELPPSDGLFRVLYYGSYIPNHGVPYIIEAAHQLDGEKSIVFQMIGTGPEKESAERIAKQYGLTKVIFTDWMDRSDLIHEIARCDLVLGVFGTTLQVSLTNNNKIYEGFAMGKPVLSGDTPALPTALQHGEHLYLCQRGDPQSIAQAVLTLKADPTLRQRLAVNGQRLFHEGFDVSHIGECFARHLYELADQRGVK